MISSIAQNNSLDILRNISKAAKNPANSLLDFLHNTIKAIGESLDADMCAIYEATRSCGFCLKVGFGISCSSEADSLIKHIKKQAEDSVQYQQVNIAQISSNKILYIIPIMLGKDFGILVLCFGCELDAFGMELINSVGDIVSSAVDRFILQQKLNNQYFSTVKSLVVAIEAKDVYTQGHSQRVAEYSKIIGMHMKLTEEEIKELEITGLVHDIGKIGVSDQLLTKPDRLTEGEFEYMRQHPEIGRKILQPLNVSENVIVGTLLHHKRYDLKGYPECISIDKLPMVPAIIGVADAFDAMTSERSYKSIISQEDAVAELKRFRGTQFHPEIVDIMEELVVSKKL